MIKIKNITMFNLNRLSVENHNIFFGYRMYHISRIIYSAKNTMDTLDVKGSVNRSNIGFGIDDNEYSLLESRLETLKNNDALPNPISGEELLLSDEQAAKLRDLSEIYSNKESLSKEEVSNLFEDQTGSTSSFAESFPYYGDNDSGLGLSPKLFKGFLKMDEAVAAETLQKKGIIKGTAEMIENYPATSILIVKGEDNLDTTSTVEELKAQVNKLERDLSRLRTELADMSKTMETLTDISNKFDRGLNIVFGVDLMKSIIRNQNNIDLLTGAFFIIGPYLAYRGLLKTYILAVDPLISNPAFMNEVKQAQLVRHRLKIIRKFNRFSISLLGASYLYIGLYYKGGLFNKPLNILKTKTTGTESLVFMSKNLRKWFFIIPLSMLSLKIFILPGVKEYFPLTYAFLVNMMNMFSLSMLLYSLFFWFFMLCVFYVIEFYIFLIYSVKSEEIKQPKFLPKFTRDWLSSLEEEGKSDNKEYFIHIYSRNILVHLILNLIIFLFICWLL